MENQNLEGLPKHDQHVMNLSENLSECESNSIESVPDSGMLSEDLKISYENDIDDHVLIPEKEANTEKQQSLENTFEVIDKESKSSHDVEEVTEVTNIIFKDEEKENDPLSFTKVKDPTSLSKPESPKEELESKIVDTSKSVINQENEPINLVQSEVKNVDTYPSEVIPEVFTKKDTDEGDIKIGPEELFCRIGLDDEKREIATKVKNQKVGCL